MEKWSEIKAKAEDLIKKANDLDKKARISLDNNDPYTAITLLDEALNHLDEVFKLFQAS